MEKGLEPTNALLSQKTRFADPDATWLTISRWSGENPCGMVWRERKMPRQNVRQ